MRCNSIIDMHENTKYDCFYSYMKNLKEYLEEKKMTCRTLLGVTEKRGKMFFYYTKIE